MVDAKDVFSALDSIHSAEETADQEFPLTGGDRGRTRHFHSKASVFWNKVGPLGAGESRSQEEKEEEERQ